MIVLQHAHRHTVVQPAQNLAGCLASHAQGVFVHLVGFVPLVMTFVVSVHAPSLSSSTMLTQRSIMNFVRSWIGNSSSVPWATPYHAPDFLCLGDHMVTTLNGCSPAVCPSGSQLNALTGSCVRCPAGTFNPTPSTSVSTFCAEQAACPAGQVVRADRTGCGKHLGDAHCLGIPVCVCAWPCILMDREFVFEDGSLHLTCNNAIAAMPLLRAECPPGSYLDEDNDCVPCGDGTFSTSPDSNSCTMCEAPKAVVAGGTACTCTAANFVPDSDGACGECCKKF